MDNIHKMPGLHFPPILNTVYLSTANKVLNLPCVPSAQISTSLVRITLAMRYTERGASEGASYPRVSQQWNTWDVRLRRLVQSFLSIPPGEDDDVKLGCYCCLRTTRLLWERMSGWEKTRRKEEEQYDVCDVKRPFCCVFFFLSLFFPCLLFHFIFILFHYIFPLLSRSIMSWLNIRCPSRERPWCHWVCTWMWENIDNCNSNLVHRCAFRIRSNARTSSQVNNLHYQKTQTHSVAIFKLKQSIDF